MKEVTGYKADKGPMFETRKEAVQYEADAHAIDIIRSWFDEGSDEDIVEFVLTHLYDIQKVAEEHKQHMTEDIPTSPLFGSKQEELNDALEVVVTYIEIFGEDIPREVSTDIVDRIHQRLNSRFVGLNYKEITYLLNKYRHHKIRTQQQ